MGSIVPGAGTVPGAGRGREDPGDGSWGWGVEGSLVFVEPENEESRKEKKRERIGSRLKGRKGGVDEEGSGHRVWGKRAKVRQRRKMQRVWRKIVEVSAERGLHNFPEKKARGAIAVWHLQTPPCFSLGGFVCISAWAGSGQLLATLTWKKSLQDQPRFTLIRHPTAQSLVWCLAHT